WSGDVEVGRGWTRGVQNGEVTVREVASVRYQLGVRTVLGGVAPDSFRSTLSDTRRGRAGGPSKRRGRGRWRSETLGIESQPVTSSRLRSPLAASVRSCSSPARPATAS